MKRIKTFSIAAALMAFTAFLSLSACDSASLEADASATLTESSGELATVLVADLGLTGDQQAQVAALFSRYGDDTDREPGLLWYVAADLQQRLTDEQKQRLFDRAAAGPGEGLGHGTGQGLRHGPGGFTGQQMNGPSGSHQGFGQQRQGGGFGPLDQILTDEQKEQAQAIRESVRAEMESLKAAVDAGELTADEARERLQEIRESVREQIEALLTDDQKAQIEALREERAAEREARRQEADNVRNEVLGLTDDQIEAFDAINEVHRTAAEEIRDQVRNADLAREDAHEAMLTLRDQRTEQLAEIVDDTQLEIVRIHDAMALRMRHHRMQGGGGIAPGQRRLGAMGSNGPFGGGFGFGSRG